MIRKQQSDDMPERDSTAPDRVDRAALDLLARLPLMWEPLDSDKLTATEQEALKLLTAADLVERRFNLRLRLVGHPVTVDATITASGDHGLGDAVEPVAKAAWQAWAGEYLKGKAGAPQDQPTCLCERTGPEQARLTQEGQQARQDVEEGMTGLVLDCLYRRGRFFGGKVIPGRGRAETIRTQTAPVVPVQVEIVNSGPMAAIAQVIQQLFELQAKGQASGKPDDLITTEVAVSEYHTSRATIRRKIQAGELRDYRPPGASAKSKLLLSRAELDRLFARKK